MRILYGVFGYGRGHGCRAVFSTAGNQLVGEALCAVPRPGWCTYLVTYRCNARCGMCDSWRMKPGTELAPSDVARVFERIGALDIVRLSGGEPFLRAPFALGIFRSAIS
jgi:pyruvate-formate lyase-activating enzyme